MMRSNQTPKKTIEAIVKELKKAYKNYDSQSSDQSERKGAIPSPFMMKFYTKEIDRLEKELISHPDYKEENYSTILRRKPEPTQPEMINKSTADRPSKLGLFAIAAITIGAAYITTELSKKYMP